jgi:hypothetical protein
MRTSRPTPTDYTVLRGRPVPALPYCLSMRVHDWWAGHRDGRIDLTGLEAADHASAAELTPQTSVWLSHNVHREQERHHQEELAHQARTILLHIRHDQVAADLETARTERDEAVALLADLPELTAQERARRGAAETRTPGAVIEDRRVREHRRDVVAPARSRVASAEARLTALTAELHDLASQLHALHEVTLTRQARISELHERRGAVYRRAYLRAHRRTHRRADRQVVRLAERRTAREG